MPSTQLQAGTPTTYPTQLDLLVEYVAHKLQTLTTQKNPCAHPLAIKAYEDVLAHLLALQNQTDPDLQPQQADG